jgi:fatty acid desaturase
MAPPESLLPHTLPSDRLNEAGRPLPPLRDALRRIPNLRNALNVVGVWLQSFGLIALAIWLDNPLMWLATFFLIGRAFALFAILAHESAHRLLFSRKAVNDWVGRWLVGYPAFVPTDIYRRGHMAHHRDEFGPAEPDLGLYANYPTTRASLRRKLTRDAFFVSGWKNLKPLLLAAKRKESRPLALRILGTQAAIALVFTVAGAWWVYPVFWLAPWMTVWRVINRLRSIAEHGGMERSADRRRTTHHVEQHWLARFWMVPYNTGWHLAHHVDSGVPFQHLPELHRELVAAGWVTPTITYPNYRSLWRALSSASSDTRRVA